MLRVFINKVIKIIRVRKQRLGQIATIGKSVEIHETVKFNFRNNLSIGSYVYLGPSCNIDAEGGIEIRDGAILGPHIVILSSSHNYKQTNMLPYDENQIHRKVVIGRGVWIGWGAIICPGVTISDGAVVAMGSVVTKNVAAGIVVGGNPAVEINKRDDPEFVQNCVSNNGYYLKAKFIDGLDRGERGVGNV